MFDLATRNQYLVKVLLGLKVEPKYIFSFRMFFNIFRMLLDILGQWKTPCSWSK